MKCEGSKLRPKFRLGMSAKARRQMLGDVIFTPREDKTIDFSDQDQTYKAVLHRCPD